jgi:hypothetical protein
MRNSKLVGSLAVKVLPIVLALLILYLPAGGSRAQPAGDRARVTYLFGDSVSAADEYFIREGVRFAQDYAIATFGSDLSRKLVVQVIYDPTDYVSYARDYRININTSTFATMPPLVRLKFLVHEYFHLWQEDASKRRFSSPSEVHALGPQWLIEGSAEYVGLHSLRATGIVSPEEIRQRMIQLANGAHSGTPPILPQLAEFQTHQDLMSRPEASCCLYDLSALAIEILVGDNGPPALGAYFRALGESQEPWEAVFARTFGLSVEEFYSSFEEQRASMLAGSTGVDASQLLFVPAFNSAPAPIGLGAVPETAFPGEQLLVYGWTGAGATCELRVPDDAAEAPDVLPTFADAYGLVFWLWSVPDEPGQRLISLEFDCGGGPVSAPVRIAEDDEPDDPPSPGQGN